MPLIDDVKAITNIDDNEYLQTMIPILIDYANQKTKRDFTESDMPDGVKWFIAKACEFNASDAKLQSRSMGSVSYSYNTEFPASITDSLKPYQRLRLF